MDILHKMGENFFCFFCPGCKYGHAVTVNGRRNDLNASWKWNGSMSQPTFFPSIHCDAGGSHECHCFVTDGMIQFLADCKHSLAGKKVELPVWD